MCMARPQNDETSLRKLNFVGKKTYAVSLPIDLIKQLNWVKGDDLMVRRHGKTILIEKVTKENV